MPWHNFSESVNKLTNLNDKIKSSNFQRSIVENYYLFGFRGNVLKFKR